MNWRVFFQRLGSAIVFAVVMMAGLLLPNPLAIFTLALLIQFLCLSEFMRLTRRIVSQAQFGLPAQVLIHLGGLSVVTAVAIARVELMSLALIFPVVILLVTGLSKRESVITGLIGIGGFLYISLPLGFLVVMRNIHWVLPLALILMIWMNDTMAYIVGSFIGKRPFSSISPKKTWEGSIGGAVLTLGGTAIWAYCSPLDAAFAAQDWFALALIAVMAGTAGDLFESKLKRLAQVKDSGAIMPGHGGALDRFDSLLVSLPFAFCYICFFVHVIF